MLISYKNIRLQRQGMSVEKSEKRQDENVRRHEVEDPSEKVRIDSLFSIIKRGWK